MRAHLVQFDIAWEEPRSNFERVAALVDGVKPDRGDLVLLPEMFDTGFSLHVERTADAGQTLGFLTDLARRHGVFVQGGRTVREGAAARATNRAPVLSPEGMLLTEYRKIHPFSYGREPERFDGGTEVMTYRWGVEKARGDSTLPPAYLTVCPAICYDLRFPELFRLGLTRGAQAFTIGANWPQARQAHWRALLVARAIENQAFVLGVNRVGRDPNVVYAGGSIALGPRGEVLGELGAAEGVLSVVLDPQELHGWRQTFPAWRDARLLRGFVAGA